MYAILTMLLVLGDCQADGRIDLQDLRGMWPCLQGPGVALQDPACECADLDGDGDSDLFDMGLFQIRFDEEDPCGRVTGSCLASHDPPGCADETCCAEVCTVDAFCCHGAWDALCVQTALTLCGAPQPPANDRCSAATVANDGTTAFSNVYATMAGPNEGERCDYLEFYADIWFTYTATCTGLAIVSLCGSEYDTTLAVYSGSVCPTQPRAIQCSDDDCLDLESRTIVPVVQGHTYLVRVGGYDEDETGLGVLSIRCTADGSNSDVCRAGGSDCGSPHRAPGCADVEFCEEQCDADPTCCDVTWRSCASEPPPLPGTCGPDSPGQCRGRVEGHVCGTPSRPGRCVGAPVCHCQACPPRGCR